MNNLVPARPPEAAEEWLKIVSHLVRGAGLSEDDVRRVVQALKSSEELRYVESALRQYLVTQADAGAAAAAQPGAAAAVPASTALAPLPPPVLDATARPSEELVVAHDPFDPHSERIRALRTELLLRLPADYCGPLAVVSPDPAEGRSRLAAELAVACAQLGAPTLLVDADLRNGRQHALFQAANAPGLADALAGGTEPPLHGVHGLPVLALLTAGSRHDHPLELLCGGSFAALLNEWRRRYRYVILDTPAVSRYSDALAVASQCGHVVVVSRAQRTRLRAGREMLQRLAATRARVLGSVVNHF